MGRTIVRKALTARNRDVWKESAHLPFAEIVVYFSVVTHQIWKGEPYELRGIESTIEERDSLELYDLIEEVDEEIQELTKELRKTA